MTDHLFKRIKEHEREIQEARDRAEDGRNQVENSDESLRLYLMSIPLFVLGASIASINDLAISLPFVELTAWVLFLGSFSIGLVQHTSSSILTREIYDGIERMWDRHEANKKVELIEEYIRKETDEKARSILANYLNEEERRAEETDRSPETYFATLARNHKKQYEAFAEYGGSVFLLLLVLGFVFFFISRGANLW